MYEGSISGLIIDPEIKYSKPTIASPTPIGVLGTFKVIPAVNKPKKNKITNPITKDKVNSKNKTDSSVIFKFKKIFETIVIVKKLNIANGTPELALADKYIKKGVGLNMIFLMFLNHSLSEVIAQYISSTWLCTSPQVLIPIMTQSKSFMFDPLEATEYIIDKIIAEEIGLIVLTNRTFIGDAQLVSIRHPMIREEINPLYIFLCFIAILKLTSQTLLPTFPYNLMYILKI